MKTEAVSRRRRLRAGLPAVAGLPGVCSRLQDTRLRCPHWTGDTV